MADLNVVAALSGFELASLTMLIGVVVSTVVRRRTGINPGGIIAAPMMLLSAHTSLAWALVIPLVAILLAHAYNRFFGHVYAGRVPLFILAFISVSVMLIIGETMKATGLIPAYDAGYPLGIILPAILANSIRKQGTERTLAYMLLALALTAGAVGVIWEAGRLLGDDWHELDRLLENRATLDAEWNSALYLLSIGLGYVIYRWSGIKSAGFIVLPFLANLLLASPLNFGLVMGLAALALGITYLVRRYTLLIGISRYAFVFALSVLLVWTAEFIILHSTQTFSPFLGTSIVASLVISVLVNEHTIYGPRRSAPLLAAGVAVMTVMAIGVQWAFHAAQIIAHHH